MNEATSVFYHLTPRPLESSNPGILMINSIIYEAQLIGFKEGIKAGLVWLVFYSYLLSNDRKSLAKSFYTGISLSLLLGLSFLLFPESPVSGDFIGNIISMSFALFLIFSGAALYHASGVDLFVFRDGMRSEFVIRTLVFSLTVIFFLPDFTGSAVYLNELAELKENTFMTAVSAAAGIMIAAVIIFSFVRLYKPFWLGSFFAFPQLLLFLAMVKLFGSGIKGISELSLIPSVQRGFIKFIHDLVHQTFVMLMVPDHPLLKKTTWDFIGTFFGPGFASIASLFILLALPALFINHTLFRPLPEPPARTNIARRKTRALMLSDRRKKAVPVIFFMVFIISAWFSYGGEKVLQVYDPEPRPVVADNGVIVIPLKDPVTDVMDGRLHKFSFVHEGEEVRVMVIKKADNSLSVCLDACEICPPSGYGQRDDHVVCLYCSTPIPVNTLGRAGGCNPVPLAADIGDGFIRIELKEIIKKWGFVNSGR